MMPIRIALIGVGKIAHDQHVPSICADPRFDLVATADPVAVLDGVAAYPDLSTLLRHGPAISAISVCTPPAGRRALVAEAIDAGLDVMMEKPPGTDAADVDFLRAHAVERNTTLFATWHSREAGAVKPARAWLDGRRIDRFTIEWREDIRRWHPGQDWILSRGGFGVFDPGINALSILTALLPEVLVVTAAEFAVPSNREAPIAAVLDLRSGTGTGTMTLDFLNAGEQCWSIGVETDGGTLSISNGGSELTIGDGNTTVYPNEEYARLYARFHDLIVDRASDVDASPLVAVDDAFRIARHRTVDPFTW